MRKCVVLIAAVMMCGMFAQSAYALFDDESINTAAQAQAQAAALAAAGAAAKGGDASSSTSNEYREYRNAARGSVTQYVPVGNEGQGLLTPWGGATAQKQGEITKLSMVYDMCGESVECRQDALTQAIEAAQPCSFIGLWPKRIGGPLCWAAIRVNLHR